jgi:hypothetical protein
MGQKVFELLFMQHISIDKKEYSVEQQGLIMVYNSKRIPAYIVVV